MRQSYRGKVELIHTLYILTMEESDKGSPVRREFYPHGQDFMKEHTIISAQVLDLKGLPFGRSDIHLDVRHHSIVVTIPFINMSGGQILLMVTESDENLTL